MQNLVSGCRLDSDFKSLVSQDGILYPNSLWRPTSIISMPWKVAVSLVFQRLGEGDRMPSRRQYTI